MPFSSVVINRLKENMNVINNFSATSGLKFQNNKEKKRNQCGLVQPKIMKLNL